jgi:uncharacterized protein YndB with AHSA1/START domain
MTQDIAGLIGAVTREVTGREHNGRPARVVRASRTYDTTMDDVWDAITSAERIPRWFLPVSGDLRLGGRYLGRASIASGTDAEAAKAAAERTTAFYTGAPVKDG